jgi:cell division protein FtsB
MLRPTRLLALGGLVLIAVLYWKPLHTYENTKAQLERRQAQVASLQAQRTQLQQRIASIADGDTLVSEARRLGLVKPNERLFIVRGIAAWRKAHR